ncbi:DUF4150 domain-containing protein [Erwinia sp. J316]|uniref:DUF4150 domain-containing protein n=2 Tax=Erwinia sorbitola TaxID=2681984 RepID=A0A6I6ES41_9GAMM|nr:DUF4150 domain-containing protein [Erwinia sorbitola]QGU89631.1 DUF4150 domain-containing protein [Erwinia sorbitola]
MAARINVNGLTLCHKGSGGVSHNTLPDVCKIPGSGIPVPFQNEAFSRTLTKSTVSVFADGGNTIANMGSQFAGSIFDEPGALGGIVSGTNMAEAEWMTGSFDVFIEKKSACRLSDKMWMNRRNTVNMSGLRQPGLPEDEFLKLICEIAVECYIQHCNNLKGNKGASGAEYHQFEQCVDDKIREKNYNGRYPEDDSSVWSEVHFDKNLELIKQGGGRGPFPSARPITPKGGRRMDIIRVDPVTKQPLGLYDLKFPTDKTTLPHKRLEDYRNMAEKLNAKYQTYEVKEMCDGFPDECPNPRRAPAPEPAPAPAAEKKENSGRAWAGLITLGVVAVAVTVFPLDGPAGDVVAWGAFGAQAAAMGIW